MSALMHDGFEDEECRLMQRLARPGSWVIDVGANIGIHAIPLASSVAPGRVIAVEPVPDTVDRLTQNAELNDIANLDVRQVAAGADVGVVDMHLADDLAYASTGVVAGRHATSQTLRVDQTTLDRLWASAGEPELSVVKIDVEGSEVAVLQGAVMILEAQRPSIIAEASDVAALRALEVALARHGYGRRYVEHLMFWNHLFLPRGADPLHR